MSFQECIHDSKAILAAFERIGVDAAGPKAYRTLRRSVAAIGSLINASMDARESKEDRVLASPQPHAAAILLYRTDITPLHILVKWEKSYRGATLLKDKPVLALLGGKLQGAERPIDAAAREFQEETGFAIGSPEYWRSFVCRPWPSVASRDFGYTMFIINAKHVPELNPIDIPATFATAMSAPRIADKVDVAIKLEWRPLPTIRDIGAYPWCRSVCVLFGKTGVIQYLRTKKTRPATAIPAVKTETKSSPRKNGSDVRNMEKAIQLLVEAVRGTDGLLVAIDERLLKIRPCQVASPAGDALLWGKSCYTVKTTADGNKLPMDSLRKQNLIRVGVPESSQKAL